MKPFKAIAAMSRNRVIGRDNQIPWHLPDDFKWFKKTTMGQVLVMGRKTFESIGRVLPGRQTMVLSRTGFQHPNVITLPDVATLWETTAEDPRDIFICGGAEIYAATLPLCSDLFLTVVQKEVEGDAFFPEFEDRFRLSAVIEEHAEFTIHHYVNPSPLPQ